VPAFPSRTRDEEQVEAAAPRRPPREPPLTVLSDHLPPEAIEASLREFA
jgi:hypothetical protein